MKQTCPLQPSTQALIQSESCEELLAARDEGGYVRSSSPPLSREMQTQEAVTADSLQDNIWIFQLQVRLLLVTGPE